MAEKKYYKLSERRLKNGETKKVITIDDTVKPTKRDLEDVKVYVYGGYIIAHKSQKRAEAARKRVIDNGGRIGKNKKEETKESAE